MNKPILPFIIIALGCIVLSCQNATNNKEKPIATVSDKALYPSDVAEIFPEKVSKTDSLQLLKAHVERWVRRQLMLNRAEKNLTNEQKDVTQQIEDYRSFLLIFKYEQEYVRQRLDTAISRTEIESFYRSNLDNFVLNDNLVKALYIKLPKENTYNDRIKTLYKSQKEDDIKALDNLAYQVAIKYDYFNDSWVPFARITKELPGAIDNPDEFLKRNRTIEMEDDKFIYLVSIREVSLKGQTSPLHYEIENIKSIILNKRKQKLISDLEIKIYNDARNHNQFQINVE